MVVAGRNLLSHEHQQFLGSGFVVAFPPFVLGIQPEMIGQNQVIHSRLEASLDDLSGSDGCVVGIGGVKMDAAGVIHHDGNSKVKIKKTKRSLSLFCIFNFEFCIRSIWARTVREYQSEDA